MAKTIIGIIGGHFQNTNVEALRVAEFMGFEIGKRGMAIVCGGYDGIMEAACKGCKQSGGTTIGILKGNQASAANPYVDYPILTSMDVACNNIIVWTAAGIVAFDGRYGTLNEIALALDFGKPIITIGKHQLLNFANVDSENFLYFEGYDPMRVPEILNQLERLIQGKEK